MTFTPGIPADGQSLGNSKPQVRGNFTSIYNTIAVNHLAVSAGNQGKHKFLQMPEQGSAPTTTVDECGFYSAASGSFTNLFWKQEDGGADPKKDQGAIIQLTNIVPTNATKGATFLPGGLLLQWDKVALTGATTSVTFQETFDAATVPYSIQLTFAITSTALLSVSQSSVTNAGFDIKCAPTPSGGPPVYYLAIGKRTT